MPDEGTARATGRPRHDVVIVGGGAAGMAAAWQLRDKDILLRRVAQGHGAQVQLELLRRYHGEPDIASDRGSRRTEAELLDAAAEARQDH